MSRSILLPSTLCSILHPCFSPFIFEKCTHTRWLLGPPKYSVRETGQVKCRILCRNREVPGPPAPFFPPVVYLQDVQADSRGSYCREGTRTLHTHWNYRKHCQNNKFGRDLFRGLVSGILSTSFGPPLKGWNFEVLYWVRTHVGPGGNRSLFMIFFFFKKRSHQHSWLWASGLD
jgi:hypothetical protein